MKPTSPLLALPLLLAGAAPAQQPMPALPTVAAAELPWPTDRVLTDSTAAGAIWAGTASWKAKFDASGAAFSPFLGGDSASACATFGLRGARAGEVTLAVTAAAPQLHEQRISYERGAVLEWFDLRQDGVEQQFVLPWLPNRDTLQLDVGVATDLEHRTVAGGHAFAASAGGVMYGAAVAIDASGASLPLVTTWCDGALQITVPAAFLAHAQLPLRIDPLIGSIANATVPSALALSNTDIAYDQSLGQYFVCYERAFNAADHDVYVVRLDAAMQPLGLLSIDFTTAYWSHPRIAALEAYDRVGVVAQVSTGNVSPFDVQVRMFTGGLAPTVDPAVLVTTALSDYVEPDIGGDANATGPVNFLVGFETRSGPSYSVPQCRLVGPNGQLGQVVTPSSGLGVHRGIAISKSCGLVGGGTEGWALVNRVELAAQTTGFLMAWFVTRTGFLRDAAGIYQFAVLTAQTDNAGSMWDVSSPTDEANGREFLCVERRFDAVTGRGTIFGHCFDHVGSPLASDVSLIAGSTDRRAPVVDSDGCRFGVLNENRYSATDTDVRANTIARVGSQLVVQDTAVVSLSVDRDDQPAICARTGSSNRYGIAWTHFASNAWSIQCLAYRGAAASGIVVRQTSCGGLGISYAGALGLGETFTVTIDNQTGIGGFLVGGAVNVPIGPCPGCTQGADGITLLGSQLAVLVPTDPALVGAALSFQGVRYNPVLGPCLGILAFSNTVDAVVQ